MFPPEITTIATLSTPIDEEEIQKAQGADALTQHLKGLKKEKGTVKLEHWSWRDKTLYFDNQIYVPQDTKLHQKLIAFYHEHPAHGHPGNFRTLALLKN